MSSLVPFPRPTVPQQTFAAAASRLAGTVAVVTWRADAPGGVLVRAVSLLSTRPARVLFGVAKEHPAHAPLLRADTFAVNLLSETDEDEAERFSRSAPAQGLFPTDRWRVDAERPPRFLAAAVHLLGEVDHRIDAGSHSLFVVRVDQADINDRAPLVAFDHGFRRLAPSAPPALGTGGASA
ncbi:MAG: flavin reductase family protein [Caulobacteraceae bacterium]